MFQIIYELISFSVLRCPRVLNTVTCNQNLFYYFVLLTVESSLAPSPLLASAETDCSLKEADIKPYDKDEHLNDFYYSKLFTSQCPFEYYLNITLYLSLVSMHWLQTQIRTILNYVRCQSFCEGRDMDNPGQELWDFSKEVLWHYFLDNKLLTTFYLLIFLRLLTCLLYVNILGYEMEGIRIRIAEHKAAEENNPTTKDSLLDCADKNYRT